MKRALILVDLQNDFLPGGALAVPKGNEVVPLANIVQHQFQTVIATQDWHPREHGSFAANHADKQPGDVVLLNGLSQVLWPVHCVQGTFGAALASELDTSRISKVFRKGDNPQIDSYSGFFDNGHRRSTGLGDWLSQQSIDHVYVMGLATDYCVRFTAIDARQLGFATTLIVDACRAVNLQPGDAERAIEAMRQAGVDLQTVNDIVRC